MTILYAKSEPAPDGETIKEHTDSLISRWKKLKQSYPDLLKTEHLWTILKIAALYHDTGKAYTPFQENIKKNMGLPYTDTTLPYVPHNFLSPLFLPLDTLGLSQEEEEILIQAIAYHHEKQDKYPGDDRLDQLWKDDLRVKSPFLANEFEQPMNDESEADFFIIQEMNPHERIGPRSPLYLDYVRIKGLLHRLDHAASAHIPIELDADVDLAKLVEKSMTQVGYHLREIQAFAKEHQTDNLMLIAQTGIGKTEAGLLWAGKKKTFFTLPVRVSINALFSRVYDGMGFKGVGLLHSTSANYLDDKGIENWEVISDQSRHLANKLSFTTIDQILKFPFLYLGYEKYYATMAYSSLIIDEIQAYDPKIVAVIIKALEMIKQIGGHFLIMTATLPRIYLEEMFKRGIVTQRDVKIKTFFDPILTHRHRLFLKNAPIDSDIDRILSAGKEKKVLVICNTIKKAVNLYNSMEGENVHLLHSHFVQKHRNLLEKEIQRFDKEEKHGIWITTQLVEASIDIDFDELYTELSTLDSLFQRFGRCYRKRNLNTTAPNILIYTKEASGIGYVYDKDIVRLGLAVLKDYHNKIITEDEKVALVDVLYSKEQLRGTAFLKKFEMAMEEMEARFSEPYQLTAKESQKLLRDIESFLVIPERLYDRHLNLFEKLTDEEDSNQRQKIRREIEQYTVSIAPGVLYKDGEKVVNAVYPLTHYRYAKNGEKYNIMPNLLILSDEYDFDEETLSGIGIKIVQRGFENL